ncbi:membrane-bound acid phosphatase 2, putative [Trypanosoma cruzi]|uniref:Membrane-bound acid phosphatase 2, putative n=1 Tax=Trypanosoma cruzi (strain CL Brener) TaxID=353153 RepID=Q4DZS9_TRYCC|nr:membrane-bound acid phosphatase 2, putative [Trypanosoma cruzi]EAN98050.1 membrane-bound acid phosphatase 2, putative [Trypanosoma cruzi]|eukprot:XP_819901.1 membrane-bound acid phosphatase 2 [Trypanosoma cruzi strain CL Brener]
MYFFLLKEGQTTAGGVYLRARYVAVWLFFLLLVHVGSGNAAVTLRLVQLVHRHGSRSALVHHNQTQICGDVPCGQLNSHGKDMLIKVGTFLRERYNSDPTNPFFPSESYDVEVSYTRSTDVPRTLQSAVGLLYGLFPNRSAAFPVIHTVIRGTDWLLNGGLSPFATVFYLLDDAWKRDVGNKEVDKIIDFSTLQAIAKEAFSEGYCADPANRWDCAYVLFDIGAALQADGRIESLKLLKANLERLRSFSRFYYSSQYAYNSSDEQHVRMGSQGQNLAQQLLANAELHMQGKANYKLYHYSAHDTTLMPLAATLGDIGPESMMPPFAQLYAFELLYDDSTNTHSIRAMRGSPEQTPDTNHRFSWDGFQLRCMDSNGNVYNASQNTCLYQDFKRFVDSTRPTDPAGLCYLNDRYKALLKCPTREGKPLNNHCMAYRKLCPAWSCDSDFTLDPVTLQCVCTAASCMEKGGEKGGKVLGASGIAGVAIPSFFVGAILAACIAVIALGWYFRWGASDILVQPA